MASPTPPTPPGPPTPPTPPTPPNAAAPGDRGHEITLLLQSVTPEDPRAVDRLFPMLYEELRRLARAKMGETPGGGAGATLQATALVHEAFVRLVHKGTPAYENRRHFFFAAARAMQDILVEQHRRRSALKRGGGVRRDDLREAEVAGPEGAGGDDVVGIAEKLAELERADPRKAQVVRLRYFAGLSAEETAAAMDVSLSTVEREWRFARALLHTMLAGG